MVRRSRDDDGEIAVESKKSSCSEGGSCESELLPASSDSWHYIVST